MPLLSLYHCVVSLYNCMIVIIGMTNVQASTENAEAFDRLNRRLDNEVKNFTAMVKEVSST